jgi:hypothetical protein
MQQAVTNTYLTLLGAEELGCTVPPGAPPGGVAFVIVPSVGVTSPALGGDPDGGGSLGGCVPPQDTAELTTAQITNSTLVFISTSPRWMGITN